MSELSLNPNYKIEEQIISYSDIPIYIGLLKGNKNYSHLLSIIISDQKDLEIRQNRFKISYFLINPNEYKVGIIHSYTNGETILPSIKGIFSSAEYFEKELTYKHNIFFKSRFLNEKDFIAEDDFFSKISNKLKRVYDIDHSVMGNFYFSRENTVIKEEKKIKPVIGFYHREIESCLEKVNPVNLPFYLEKVNPEIGAFYSITYLKMMEKELSFEVSDKTKCLRMVICEILRIKSHLAVISRINYSIAKNRISDRLVYLSQELFKKIASMSPANSISPLFELGGFNKRLPEGWGGEILEFLTHLKTFLYQSHLELVKNMDWRGCFNQISLDKNLAYELGLTGPNLRASGINWDLREKSTDYFYQDIEFEVPIGKAGTSYDRYLVRLEEIYQSIHIIDQLLNNMPLEVSEYSPSNHMREKEQKENFLNEFEQKKLFRDMKIKQMKSFSSLYMEEYPEGVSGLFLNQLAIPSEPLKITLINPHHNALNFFCDYIEQNELHSTFDLEFYSFGISFLEVEK